MGVRVSGFLCALAVKEIESGEFHWMLLREEETSDDLLSYRPERLSESYRDAPAAWAAGYLALRAAMRKSATVDTVTSLGAGRGTAHRPHEFPQASRAPCVAL
jgi:hypothetical protein